MFIYLDKLRTDQYHGIISTKLIKKCLCNQFYDNEKKKKLYKQYRLANFLWIFLLSHLTTQYHLLLSSTNKERKMLYVLLLT